MLAKIHYRRVIQYLCLIGLVVLTLRIVTEKPSLNIPNWTTEKFAQALQNNEIKTLQYQAETNEFFGTLKSSAQKTYGGESFRQSAGLTQKQYQQILEQKLASARFIGPVDGFQDEPEFQKLAHIQNIEKLSPLATKKLADLPFQPGEMAAYDLSVLKLSVGRIRWDVKLPKLVASTECLEINVFITSSSNFARVARINDQGTLYFDIVKSLPRAFQMKINESLQFGSVHGLNIKPTQNYLWQRLITERRGETAVKQTLSAPEQTQNPLSILFYLRLLPWDKIKTQNITLIDRDKQLQLVVKVIGEENVTTPLGDKKAWMLQPQLIVDGKQKNIPPITVWLTQDEKRLIAKFAADVKIGSVSATLTEYQAGRH